MDIFGFYRTQGTSRSSRSSLRRRAASQNFAQVNATVVNLMLDTFDVGQAIIEAARAGGGCCQLSRG